MPNLIDKIRFEVGTSKNKYKNIIFLEIDMYLYGEHLGYVEFRKEVNHSKLKSEPYILSYYETMIAPYFSLDYKMLIQLAADYLKSLGYNNIKINLS